MEDADYQLEENTLLPFSEVTQMFVNQVTDALQPPADPQMQARFLFGGYYGCNDAFSVFGFLAFLLALFDLIMELQEDAEEDMTRSVRDVSARQEGAPDFLTDQLLPINAKVSIKESKPAAEACYNMLRGFLNGMMVGDAACAERFLCEGAEAAAATGDFGQVIAKVVSRNAAGWMSRAREAQYEGVGEAGLAGARGESCAGRYSKCEESPPFFSAASMNDPDEY